LWGKKNIKANLKWKAPTAFDRKTLGLKKLKVISVLHLACVTGTKAEEGLLDDFLVNFSDFRLRGGRG